MSDGKGFHVEVRRADGRLVVVPSGELDIATAGRVRAALAQRVPGEDVELDLSELTFLDTSGLQLVVETHRRATEEGFQLRVVPGNREVQRVFQIAGLVSVLPFEDPAGAG